MNMQELRGQASIIGIGTAGKDATGHTELEILALAAKRAVSDAGLEMKDIDGIATASASSAMWVMPVIEYLGLRPSFQLSTMIGGSSFVAHLLPAIQALMFGQCKAVLVCYGSTQRSSTLNRAEIARLRKVMDPVPHEQIYNPLNPLSSYALVAARHMHEYGTTRRDLAEVAVAARKWAQLNPEALKQDPLSIEDVLAARMISDPLSVRDCCLVSDGAGAFVLTRSDLAKDAPNAPVHVLGAASAIWHRQISAMADLTVTAATESGAKAFDMAGLKPSDVDLAEVYDAFTINTILFMEDLGFCKKGEGADFVKNGGIAPGGHFAVNTNGGGLSCIHPGMYGVFTIIEAVQQLRGTAGDRQVTGAEVALAHGNGGALSSQATAILGTQATL